MFYDVPCVKFRQGKKTIVSINLYKDHYVFQIILGKLEREKFEIVKYEFPLEIQELYDCVDMDDALGALLTPEESAYM